MAEQDWFTQQQQQTQGDWFAQQQAGGEPPAAQQPPSLGRQIAKASLDVLPGIGGIVGGVLSTPGTIGVGTVPGVALGVGAGRGLRDLIADATGLDEDTTPGQKALNIAGNTAEAAVTGYMLPGLVTAARTPVRTAREFSDHVASALPQWMRRVGRVIPRAPDAPPAPVLQRPAWQTWDDAAVVADDVPLPRTTTGTGAAVSQPTGAPPTWGAWRPQASGIPQPTRTSAASTAPATGISEAERAALAKQGYTPDVIARIEQATGQPARTAATPAASTPTAPASPTAQPQPDLQGPRIRIGAERVGRTAGLTKEEVRQAAGPVLDEAAGEASPILPRQALSRIIDDMKALPPGAEREAYVARATSGKTKWQVENIRRTLEHLGLLVPVAAAVPDVRAGLMRMMTSRDQ